MTSLQILLIIVIITLTILLVVIGTQIFFVVSDIRKVIKKVNSMIEGKEGIDEVVTKERVQKAMNYLRNKLPFLNK